MKAAQFFGAIGVNLCLAVIAWGQVTPSGALPGELRSLHPGPAGDCHLHQGAADWSCSGLQTLFGGHTLDIAETGAAFQVGEKSVAPPPTRRLVAAGCSGRGYRLVYYERGGQHPHVARGAVSLDTGGDEIRVGQDGSRWPVDNRRCPEGYPVRRDQRPGCRLVMRF